MAAQEKVNMVEKVTDNLVGNASLSPFSKTFFWGEPECEGINIKECLWERFNSFIDFVCSSFMFKENFKH